MTREQRRALAARCNGVAYLAGGKHPGLRLRLFSGLLTPAPRPTQFVRRFRLGQVSGRGAPALLNGAPWCPVRIEACEPPLRLAVSMQDEAGSWSLELTEAEGTTELRLIHHLTPTDQLGSTGPSWEYYVDRLTASHTDGPQPDFEDDYPAQKAYVESLA